MKRLAIALAIIAAVIVGWAVFKKKSPPAKDLANGMQETKAGQVNTKKKTDPKAIKAEIQAAVEAGKLTQEQADAKLKWLENAEAKKEFAEEQADIRDAVALGWEKFASNNPTAGDPAAKKPVDPEAARARIQAAVEAGKLIQEQADAKLRGLEGQGK